MSWHVVSVNSRMEIETAARINSGGFIAHCPTWIKKSAHHRGTRHFFKAKTEVLFPTYLFVQEDAAFRSDKFETSKTRLIVFRKQLLTDAQMTLINSTALDLTMLQSKSTDSLQIRKGDVMQILHGAMQGDPVEVLQMKKDELLIRWKDRPGWRDAWINRTSVGKAI